MRFYGNRNKIIRVRNEVAIWYIQGIANRLGITYQEASEAVFDDLEKRGCFDWEAHASLIDRLRIAPKQ